MEGQLNLANQIIFWIPFLIVVGILLWLWRQDVLDGAIPLDKLKNAIIVVVAIYILQLLARIGLLYYFLKKDPLGAYLLPGQGTNFFVQNIWATLKPLFLATLVAVVLALIVILIKRLIQRPLFEDVDVYVIFLTSFLVGFPGIFVLLIGTFLLMIIWQLVRGAVLSFDRLRTIPSEVEGLKTPLNQFRVRLSPFLIFVCLAQLVLNNFHFYQSFLVKLHLL